VNVLVTGGAGFIGAAAVRRLLADGHEVVVYDDLSTGRASNVPDGVQVIWGDVRDRHAVQRACHGRDAVVHLAAFVSVPASFTEAPRCRAVNVDGTRFVLDGAAKAGVGRLVLASTAAVYGPTPIAPTPERAAHAPASPYADSKLAAERAVLGPQRPAGLESVVLRFFNVYGPRQRPDSAYAGVVAKAMSRLAAGQPFVVFGDGLQTRDYVFVDDVAAAIAAAVTRPGVDGLVANVGRGEEATLLDLVAAVGRVVGREPQLVFEPPRPGDARRSVADVGQLATRLGVRAQVPLDKGLLALHEWLLETSKEKSAAPSAG
jgi:UDP-glucose 4-epimerase